MVRSNATTPELARSIRKRLVAQRERSVAGLRRLRRAISRELKPHSGQEVLRVVEQLIESGSARWFAYELAHHHPGAMSQLSSAALERLAKGLADWGSVDPFALYLLGPAYRTGQITSAQLARWARSRDRWRRRAALVASVALNNKTRGGVGDAARTLAICDRLLDDRDDMVVKALSWALRELATKTPADVESYLKQHEQRLAARVLREVRSKLATGLKNPRRATRGASTTT